MNIIPTRFRFINRYLHSRKIKILDVGAGSHSASITKKWYPECEYHGIDRVKNYQNDERDFKLMDAFYKMDVTMLDYSTIPSDYFDVIIMSHIIEHLQNGDKVIEGLLSKLKQGGIIYTEFPSRKSLSLPSMNGTLNFYDDETHCRIFTRQEVVNIYKMNSFEILYSSVRRDWVRIFALPNRIC
ncbi:MAG: methyltransferase domain-containing protein [Ignavibacteriales bacterium]|nr:methyltransferase domain-containing protein [Ignavibacteriales bacterium]